MTEPQPPQPPYGGDQPPQPSVPPYGGPPPSPYGAPGGYGAPPPYGAPGGYGAPPPYGPPGGYGAPGGYGGPPPYPGSPYGQPGVDAYGRPLSDKSKLTAGLLQLFLGGFGVGRFYLGYSTLGILQIVVTLVTCGFGSIWGLIDAILILTDKVPDAQGRTLAP